MFPMMTDPERVGEVYLPYLEEGDLIIDGGNSNYQDSIRRTQALEAREEQGLIVAIAGDIIGSVYEAPPIKDRVFLPCSARVRASPTTRCSRWRSRGRS